MKTLIIPIHSFIDVITNSSSEVFITSDEKTIAAVYALVDNILKFAGSTKNSAELFDIVIVDYYYNKTRAELEAEVAEGKFDEGELRHLFDGSDNPPKTNIRVTPKIDTPETQAAAKTLSNLTGIFSIEAGYC